MNSTSSADRTVIVRRTGTTGPQSTASTELKSVVEFVERFAEIAPLADIRRLNVGGVNQRAIPMVVAGQTGHD